MEHTAQPGYPDSTETISVTKYPLLCEKQDKELEAISHEPKRAHRSNLLKAALTLLTALLLAGSFTAWFCTVKLSDINAVSKLPRAGPMVPLVRVAELPQKHQLGPDTTERRLVVLGDVHGMAKQMKQLLKKIKFNKKHDQLVLLGDFTTKGPDSLGVIDMAIENGAACVRGNHEDEIVSLYSIAHKLGPVLTYPPFASKSTQVFGAHPEPTKKATRGPLRNLLVTAAPSQPTDSLKTLEGTQNVEVGAQENDGDALAMAEIERLASSLNPFDKREHEINATLADEHRDMPLAKILKPHHIEYIQKCPSMLKMGQVSKRHIEAVACHGGLVWTHHELEEQDPEMVMRVRGMLPPHYVTPSEESEGVPWFEMWSDDQKHRPKSDRYEVFYGHDASKGLQVHKYSKGLDSRCVKGDKLSAMVITVDKHGRFDQKLHQVDCS